MCRLFPLKKTSPDIYHIIESVIHNLMRSVEYSLLADTLIGAYTERRIARAKKGARRPLKISVGSAPFRDGDVIRSIRSLATSTRRYSDPAAIDEALEALDLAQIFALAESEAESHPHLSYDDCLVRSLLCYFKESFFSWVNKESCPRCKNDEHMSCVGGMAPQGANPDECSMIEQWQCGSCKTVVPFPRINNPVALLKTRRGRCGEWVNCFLLCLHAVLGESAASRIRYVWNLEDHVWCEYFSTARKQWIHLDPCENSYDNPLLYADNWGKRMSIVIGFGQDYAMDLSGKYITPAKQIDVSSVLLSPHIVKHALVNVNHMLLLDAYERIRSIGGDSKMQVLSLYHAILLKQSREILELGAAHPTKTSLIAVQGRQLGSSEWTSSRGENGR